MKRLLTTVAVLLFVQVAQCQQKIVVKPEARRTVTAQWTHRLVEDEINNKTNESWVVKALGNPSVWASIENCKDMTFVLEHDVLDRSSDHHITVKFRTADMEKPDESLAAATFHAAGWPLKGGTEMFPDATQMFWRGHPKFGTKLVLQFDVVPEKVLTVTFELPPIPEKCQ